MKIDDILKHAEGEGEVIVICSEKMIERLIDDIEENSHVGATASFTGEKTFIRSVYRSGIHLYFIEKKLIDYKQLKDSIE